MTLTIEQLRAAVTNSGIVSQLSDEAVAPATNLTSLLESVVKRDKEEATKREKLQSTLKDAIPGIETLDATPQEFANEVKRFIGNAKDAYRRIGTTAASIASGEAKAISSNMLGPLNFGSQGNMPFLEKERNILGRSSQAKTRVLSLKTHVDDFKDAIVFLREQMKLVAGDKDSGLTFDKIRFEKVVKRSKGFDVGPANEYIIKTKAYLGFLMEPTLLGESIDALNDSMSMFPTDADEGDDRQWAYDLITGMCKFGQFLCNFGAAEADLLDLEGVSGRGPMQKGAIEMLRNVILTDQRMYPSNNQVSLPPPSGRLPDLNGYFDAYMQRQQLLYNATDADIVNKANAKFDRLMNIARKGYLMLGEGKYSYVPRPPVEVYDRMFADKASRTLEPVRGPPMSLEEAKEKLTLEDIPAGGDPAAARRVLEGLGIASPDGS